MQKFLIFIALLYSFFLHAGEEKSRITDMAEYHKHCKVLLNLGKAYGVLEKKKKEKKRSIGTEWNSELGREVPIDEDGNFIYDDDDKEEEDEEEESASRSAFSKLINKPDQVSALNKLEKSQLKEMSENCRDLINIIEQYRFDVVKLKGQWSVFVKSSKTDMTNLRRAFISRMKDYERIVEKK